VSEYVHGSSG